MTEEMTEATEKVVKTQKVKKDLTGSLVVITYADSDSDLIEPFELKFDSADYPDEVKERLIAFGAARRIGDAGGGKDGEAKATAMMDMHTSMVEGKFSVRKPAEKVYSVSALREKAQDNPELQRILAEMDAAENG